MRRRLKAAFSKKVASTALSEGDQSRVNSVEQEKAEYALAAEDSKALADFSPTGALHSPITTEVSFLLDGLQSKSGDAASLRPVQQSPGLQRPSSIKSCPQPNAVVGGGGLPSHMVLLTGIDAEPREVVVKSVCSMDGEFYMANRLRPGLCNIQLKAKRATVEDLEAHPARISLADAIKHILWVADNYDALEREFPDHPWNATMTVETGLDIPQDLLERLVRSLYCQRILVDPASVEALMHISDLLQVQAVMDAMAEYIKVDLIPKHPAACHELGTHVYPHLHMEEAVIQFFTRLQWDGAISQAMLQNIGTVLERCSDDTALQFVKSLTEAPSLISPLQAASMSAQLPALKREKLLEGLDIGNLSMADVQSMLHWANNRRANRAVLADSPILWNLLFNNVSSTLLPLDHLVHQVGPKAAQMKLWDLPLAHIPASPGRYKTRRSGWMHMEGGRSFCMEAVYTKDEPGAEWGLFCNPDRQHAFVPHYIIKLCAIQQGSKTPHIELSPDIKPNNEKKLGLGMGFDELLSKWASNKALVWEKQGQSYLTLGLYVDLNEPDTPAEELTMAEDPSFVLPKRVQTSDIFASMSVDSSSATKNQPPLASPLHGTRETPANPLGSPEAPGTGTTSEISADKPVARGTRRSGLPQARSGAQQGLSVEEIRRSLTPTRRSLTPPTRLSASVSPRLGAALASGAQMKTPFALNGQNGSTTQSPVTSSDRQ